MGNKEPRIKLRNTSTIPPRPHSAPHTHFMSPRSQYPNVISHLSGVCRQLQSKLGISLCCALSLSLSLSLSSLPGVHSTSLYSPPHFMSFSLLLRVFRLGPSPALQSAPSLITQDSLLCDSLIWHLNALTSRRGKKMRVDSTGTHLL